mmetsp:Transcript_102407/g.289276  ORF Transcript_102407/g.289276 Transcript_102407/m.289276 type:complete len:611 (+) Transcript_102407:572-2404(+)
MLGGDALVLGAMAVMPEGADEEVYLETQAQQRPILEFEVGEEGLALAVDVEDVLDTEDIQLLGLGAVLRLRRAVLRLPALALSLFRSLRTSVRGRRGPRIRRCGLGHHDGHRLGLRLKGGGLALHMPGVPRGEVMLPLLPLVRKPRGRLDVLDTHRRLPLQHPLLEAVRTLLSVTAGELDRIEALVLPWEREGIHLGARDRVRQVQDIGRRREPIPLLLFREFRDGRRLILDVFWLRLGPRRGVVGLALQVLEGLPFQVVRFSLRPQLVNDALLLAESHLAKPLPELSVWLPHQHHCDLAEVWETETAQGFHALFLCEVPPHFHHNEVPPLQPQQLVQDAFHAAIVQLSDSGVDVRPVVRGDHGAGSLGPPEPTTRGPFAQRAAAELAVLGVPLQKIIHPMEAALVRHADREYDVELLVARALLLLLQNLDVLPGGVSQHAAGEGQRREPPPLVEVHVERHILEGHCGKQRFASECLRQRLRLGGARTILEQRNRVHVGAPLLQVQDYSDDVVDGKFLRHGRSLAIEEHAPLRVEAYAVLRFAQNGHAIAEAEAYPQHVCGQLRLRSDARVVRGHGLHCFQLEHIAAAPHTSVGPSASKEVLQRALVARH